MHSAGTQMAEPSPSGGGTRVARGTHFRVSDWAAHMGVGDTYARTYLRRLGATVFKVDGVWWAKLKKQS